jgi:hypothetical protein
VAPVGKRGTRREGGSRRQARSGASLEGVRARSCPGLLPQSRGRR